MKVKYDEENFDEAESQAYRCWTDTNVPSEITSLFQELNLSTLTPSSPPFFHLLSALHDFTRQPPHTLPLTSTLPDMKANTSSYIHLQKLYKARAEEEKAIFKSFLKVDIDDASVDAFVKNAHALKFLRGKKWGALDADPSALGVYIQEFALHFYLRITQQTLSRPRRKQQQFTSHCLLCEPPQMRSLARPLPLSLSLLTPKAAYHLELSCLKSSRML